MYHTKITNKLEIGTYCVAAPVPVAEFLRPTQLLSVVVAVFVVALATLELCYVSIDAACGICAAGIQTTTHTQLIFLTSFFFLSFYYAIVYFLLVA